MRTLVLSTLLSICALGASSAQAQRPLLHLEGGADYFFASTQHQEQFTTGVHGIARLGLELMGPLSIQVSVSNWWFPNDNGTGRLYAFQLGPRVYFPLFEGIGGGPVADANFGLGVTGSLQRFVFDLGAGWLFPIESWIGVGPMIRYHHIVQPDSEPLGHDGRLLVFGAQISLGWPET
ncbi:MAG: hypothetical protein OEY14_12520, partial [Myxococcales bacterium]|nr:hypothetical protein [Myxococcales bacterium]